MPAASLIRWCSEKARWIVQWTSCNPGSTEASTSASEPLERNASTMLPAITLPPRRTPTAAVSS